MLPVVVAGIQSRVLIQPPRGQVLTPPLSAAEDDSAFLVLSLLAPFTV